MHKEKQIELQKYSDNHVLGRVVMVHKTNYTVHTENGTYNCQVTGRFKYLALSKSDYPVVGDYVIINPSEGVSIIERILERDTYIQRLGVSTTGDAQILASNVDIVFVVLSMNEDFRIKKLRNFMNLTNNAMYQTVILLTKSDLTDNHQYYIDAIRESNFNNDIYIVNQEDTENIQVIYSLLQEKTGVFIGSSGVGKSTLINKLINKEYLKTKEVLRSDDQGRHTTSHRELVQLDHGGAIIDTPGIRIINSYMNENIEDEFKEVLEYASQCKFSDCKHEQEPGCKVQEAIYTGDLDEMLYEAYVKTMKFNRYNLKREKQRERNQNKRKRG